MEKQNKKRIINYPLVFIIIIILIIGMGNISIGSSIFFEENSLINDLYLPMVSTPLGRNIHYVGGSGPGNYSRIQDAIENASNGDIVYIYVGIYFEAITIDKTIDLVGEKKETTIIDGNGIGDVVFVNADGVRISGLRILHSGDSFPEAGMKFHSNNNIVSGNIISQNGEFGVGIFLNESSHNTILDNKICENGNEGIYLEGSTHNLIQNNEIFCNGHCAIVLSRSTYNTIISNKMYDNHATISLWPESTHNEIAWNTMYGHPWAGIGIWEGSDYNSIHHNYLYDNPQFGITLLGTKGNVLNHNCISGSNQGIIISSSFFTVVIHNNFIGNDCDAVFDNSSRNLWIRNYWDDHISLLPKCIKGIICLPWNKSEIIPWINFDWFPARNPYRLYGDGYEF